MFQEGLSPDNRIDFQQRPQTVEDVLRVVREAAEHWTSSERRHASRCSTAVFNRVATTMDSHSTMLSALPDRELYSCLLYTVLQSVIKVRPYHNVCVQLGIPSWIKLNRHRCAIQGFNKVLQYRGRVVKNTGRHQ